jgi:flagellar biosynthesis regulator FlaF
MPNYAGVGHLDNEADVARVWVSQKDALPDLLSSLEVTAIESLQGAIAELDKEALASAKLRETQAKGAATRLVTAANKAVQQLSTSSVNGQVFAEKVYAHILESLKSKHMTFDEEHKDETFGPYLSTVEARFNAFIEQARTILSTEQPNLEKAKALSALWFTKNVETDLNEPLTSHRAAIGAQGLKGVKQFNETYKQFVASNFLPFLKTIDTDCLTDKEREKRLAAQKTQ